MARNEDALNLRLHRIAIVLGTRPEAIKMAPVIETFRSDPNFQVQVCVTGQHREMLDQILREFAIVPDVDLNLMQPGQSLASFLARALTAIDAHLQQSRPDLVLVQGDTTTVLAASLAAFYRQIPVGHIEAGLRTGDLAAPFPEESNRVLTSRLATLHFTPTSTAATNLIREGVDPERVIVTGNTVIDALLQMVNKLANHPPSLPEIPEQILQGKRRLVLITGHRRENFGASFEQICRAIATLAARFPDVAIVYPVHLNPKVREPVERILGGRFDNVYLLEPLGYREFIELFRRCTLVLTDSGGIQEEGPTLNKPVLVMRDTTERPEAVATGAVKLVGSHHDRIVSSVTELLSDPIIYQAMTGKENPYGDGKASSRILEACRKYLESQAVSSDQSVF